MAKAVLTKGNLKWEFSDKDIVNPEEMIPAGESNPHDVRGWLLHDHGFTLCVVFASSLQDALDIATDGGKLDSFLITGDPADTIYERCDTPEHPGLDAADYPTLGTDNEEGITRLGNESRPFDIESVGYVEFNPPKMSICQLYPDEETIGIRSYRT